MKISTMLILYSKEEMLRLSLNYNKEMKLLIKWLGPFSHPIFAEKEKEKSQFTRLDYTYAFYELSKIFQVSEETLILTWRNRNG